MVTNIPEGFRLTDKRAVLAVGRVGWGPVLAAALAEAGADVAVVGLDKQELAESAGAARKLGRRGIEVPTDPTKELDVRRAVKQVVRDLGRVDILVNNAQVEFFKPITEISNREFQGTVDQNVKSTFLLCKEMGRAMLDQGSGRIVNVVSGLAERGVWNGTLYCATQAAIVGMTRALGLEWARKGVRVNALGHGWITTDPPTEAEQQEALVRYIPLRRRARPEDLAAAMVYLCSDACEYVAGSCMYIDGGLLAHP